MRRRLSPFLGLCFSLFAPCAGAASTDDEVAGDAAWMRYHEAFLAEARRGNIDVLFLGDSITDFWRSRAPAIWAREFAPLKAANFGISGDRTEHVLWRLRHGEAEGFQPKVVVLLIGTNNIEVDGWFFKTLRSTTPGIVKGISAVVRELRGRFPSAKILLLGIFPRDRKGSVARAQITEVNRELAKLHDGAHVHFLDIGPSFLDADGDLLSGVMPDRLHPSEKGYEIWAREIRAPLKALLEEPRN